MFIVLKYKNLFALTVKQDRKVYQRVDLGESRNDQSTPVHMHWPVHAAAVFYLTFTQMNASIIKYTESVNWCRKLNCSRWLNLDYHSLIINLQHFLYQYQWPVTLSMSCHTSIQFLIWYLIHNQGYLISGENMKRISVMLGIWHWGNKWFIWCMKLLCGS